MAKWTLSRQIFGCEEFSLSSGDKVTVGRGNNNNITLSSAVISRNHCIIDVQNNKAVITDLKSSNGIYVGTIKIPPNTPYVIKNSDVIGLGWTVGAPLANIKDSEKYVFKLIKDKPAQITSRIRFQSDSDSNNIETEIAKLDGVLKSHKENFNEQIVISPVLCTKLSLKRKVDDHISIDVKGSKKTPATNNNIINISDSDNDIIEPNGIVDAKKLKLQSIKEESQRKLPTESEIKNENELIEYDAFNVKQEYLGYDEPINISDDESDSESEQWLLRLSQNSPGKPFSRLSKSVKQEIKPEDGSYSQLDDDFISNYLVFEDEEDTPKNIQNPEPNQNHEVPNINKLPAVVPEYDEEEFSDDIISIDKPFPVQLQTEKEPSRDEVDGYASEKLSKETEQLIKLPNEMHKKVQIIEPIAKLRKGKLHNLSENKTKSSTPKKRSRKTDKSKKHISSSHKEERKKKLKELALKDKDVETKTQRDSTEPIKPIKNIKVTSSNRGAFLSEVVQAVVKPVKRKENLNKSKDIVPDTPPKHKETRMKEKTEDLENIKKSSEKINKTKSKSTKNNDVNIPEIKSDNTAKNSVEHDVRVSLENLPLCKPVSKVGPMPCGKAKKKQVRFSNEPPQIREFEIEPGNKMKKTSLVKTMDIVRQAPVFSLEKISLMKILRWNPQWLEEQLINNDPPPILGHNNTPTLFHSFVNHNQYVQLVGDLLLMEIWECLSIAYMKTRNQNLGLQMRIESLPPISTQDRCYDFFPLGVNVSATQSEVRFLPRLGEIILVSFGSESQRFFFVQNVRPLPAAPGQTKQFYIISLLAIATERMMCLKPGELIMGKSLAYIKNELTLFEAMEYLAGSPLMDAVLKPEPQHFTNSFNSQLVNIKSQWTATLNPSQLKAVGSSVAAALSDKPSIQMVQGPPGTGKSSVICAIVMSYFYNAQGNKHQNRSKILICATSNAAVDGLVIRLLNLRQSLPKQERFRMVRVGRAEAMHSKAADISSQQLATRELTRINEQPPTTAGLNEEILHLEAKVNMWKSAMQNSIDPVRSTYCQGRMMETVKRITLLRSGCGGGGLPSACGEVRPEQLAVAERRIIEGADIIVTTLASAQNYKMKGLKRRIALCIIDEAGQVIEPETLIPLTLDVTKLTLIGDPQQLPGFICSQRAKKLGLGESLFSRLSSYTDDWGKGSPVILLNQQYRMHPDIADYPSRAFYGGMVKTIAPTRPDIGIPPYVIVGISSGDKGQGMSGANEMEAWGVSRLAAALGERARPQRLSVAVITPYNAHKELVKRHLKTLHNHNGESAVEVNTVDSFQGQERDVVVVSLARSQGVGFLTDVGRMNVLLTRARHALLICLNPYALLKHNQWRTLIEDSQRRSFYKSLPSHVCQPINAAQVQNDDILKYIIDKKYNASYR